MNKISERTRVLLNKEEGYDVDFKRTVKSLSVDDLVAFANSSTGGTILVGVDEISDENGRQIGKIVGCNIGDSEKLTILNKANDCRPSVDVEIHVENEDDTPFYRVEIPSGEHKPYSTLKGTYLIRGDGRNLPLNQGKLLNIFVQEQGETFIDRFKKATETLEEQIGKLQERIEETNGKINVFEHSIDNLQHELSDNVQDILAEIYDLTDNVSIQLSKSFDSIRNAESLSDDAMNFSMEATTSLNELDKRIGSIEYASYETNKSVNKLLEHFQVENPKVTEAKEFIKGFTVSSYDILYRDLLIKKFGREDKEKIIEKYKSIMIDTLNNSTSHDTKLIEKMVCETISEMDFSHLDK
ncbi:UNVERIFIED_ORG: putative HicB family RNase H-like nuclease [Bacillus sp. 1751]|nr:putative HicB family RNase H-like nuclease [Bacillus sp. 1751]